MCMHRDCVMCMYTQAVCLMGARGGIITRQRRKVVSKGYMLLAACLLISSRSAGSMLRASTPTAPARVASQAIITTIGPLISPRQNCTDKNSQNMRPASACSADGSGRADALVGTCRGARAACSASRTLARTSRMPSCKTKTRNPMIELFGNTHAEVCVPRCCFCQ